MECGVFNEPDGVGNDNDATSTSTSTANDDSIDIDIDSASDKALSNIKAEFDKLIDQWDATFVFVTNEIGSGLHATTLASRKFVDAQSWLNQHVAFNADMVVQMISGVPNVIKQVYVAERRDHPPRAPDKRDLAERAMLDRFLSARQLDMDDNGYFIIINDHKVGVIRATYHSCVKNDKGEVCDIHGNVIPCNGEKGPEPMATFEARTAKELTVEIFERWEHAEELVSVGHAAYIGREAEKAERCLFSGMFYKQD